MIFEPKARVGQETRFSRTEEADKSGQIDDADFADMADGVSKMQHACANGNIGEALENIHANPPQTNYFGGLLAIGGNVSLPGMPSSSAGSQRVASSSLTDSLAHRTCDAKKVYNSKKDEINKSYLQLEKALKLIDARVGQAVQQGEGSVRLGQIIETAVETQSKAEVTKKALGWAINFHKTTNGKDITKESVLSLLHDGDVIYNDVMVECKLLKGFVVASTPSA